MENVVIVGCKNNMINNCMGCYPCLVAFNNREGGFQNLLGQDAQIVGLIDCVGCPGTGVIAKLNGLDRWAHGTTNTPAAQMQILTKVYTGNCIASCPYKIGAADLKSVVQNKCHPSTSHGTHPYQPGASSIFNP